MQAERDELVLRIFPQLRRLMYKTVEVFLRLTQVAKQEHPELRETCRSFIELVSKIGVAEAEAMRLLQELFSKYGVSVA